MQQRNKDKSKEESNVSKANKKLKKKQKREQKQQEALNIFSCLQQDNFFENIIKILRFHILLLRLAENGKERKP